MKSLLNIFFLVSLVFTTNIVFSQATNLSLTVISINETCPGNGRLNFFVSNATPGGTVIFTVYKLPNLSTPIVTTQANTFTGLVAGNYRVIATESLPNGSVNTRQKDALILDAIIPMQLNFQVIDKTCLHLGKVTVLTVEGNPVLYEIISGPIILPPQNSNVFNNLPDGTYQIKVTDDCGEFVTRSLIIKNIVTDIIISQSNIKALDCNTLEVNSSIVAISGEINYPISVQTTIFEPSGNVTTSNQVLNSGDTLNQGLQFTIPYFGQAYHYQIAITDACGNTFQSGSLNVEPLLEAEVDVKILDCANNIKSVTITINNLGLPPFTLNFLSSPSGFNPILFNPSHPNFNTNTIVYQNPSINFPPGNYQLQITDSCGKVKVISFNIDNTIPTPTISVSQLKGCGEGFSTLSMSTNNSFFSITSVLLEQAPPTYSTSLPLNLSSNIYNGDFFLTDLTSGIYKFKVVDSCGNSYDVFTTITGYQKIANNFSIIEECASFKVNLQNSSNIPSSLAGFWIQKFNPVLNQWVHPITGVSGPGIGTVNAIKLFNNATSNNITSTGKFRIVKTFTSYRVPTIQNPSTSNICFEELGEFEFYFEPRIKNIYSFACNNNNSYQVVVDAVGALPLKYEIITKDGNSFYIDNGASSVFNNLTPGVYGFRVTDNCGVIKNRLFEVSGNATFPVVASSLCNGSTATLSVPYFSYLNYEWWKDNNTSTILSNSNILTFSPFNFSANFGVYHVRITNPGNPNTCIDFIVDYVIPSNLSNPNAGNDSENTICGAHGMLNLNSLLSANHDTNGFWSETSNSGIPIVNGVWDSTNVMNGLYVFNYTVNGLCSINDVAVIKVSLKSIPQSPTALADSQVCTNGTLHLYASSVLGATYNWTGPNGFTSNEQNPIINNINTSISGIYSVKAIVDGCESPQSSVTVTVTDFPDFELKTLCDSNKKVFVKFIDSTINPELFEYEWIYPDGTTHFGSQSIDLTLQQTGNYSVIVTDTNGCSSSGIIPIQCTFCSIPKGVSANADGQNDNFDLSCIEEVENVKIFNRYGVLIFEKDNYINEWGGYDKKGNLLPTGTYYYLVSFKDGNYKSGWVYLNY